MERRILSGFVLMFWPMFWLVPAPAPAVSRGDLLDFGDAPDSYGTTLAANGARHPVIPGFSLGDLVDTEADGQPTSGADGDGDDEDGIAFPGGAGQAAACSVGNVLTVTLVNEAGVAASQLDAWIDWNGNGVFEHPAEHLFGGSPIGLDPGPLELTYDVPCDAVPQAVSYARFRLEQVTALRVPPGELGNAGEVEDYPFEITGPEIDFGDAPDSYGTTLAAGGARHQVLTGFSLGAAVDGEDDGQPSAGATGDGADDDGIVFPGGATAVACSTGNAMTVTLNDSMGLGGGALDGWIDWNGNGLFDHPAEHLFGGSPVTLVDGENALTFDVPCAAVSQAVSYARFRLEPPALRVPPGGLGASGEVEDYPFEITGIDPPEPEIDFGDAPDGYGTTLAANGARHEILPGFSLGATVDGEADGQPSAGATGDGADEDGVVFSGGGTAGACSTANGLTVTLTNSAAVATPRLDAWIDWNGNSVFDHPAEHLFGGSPVALVAGPNALAFDVPCNAVPQALGYARFRLSGLAAGSLPTGDGGTGEVEDHPFAITGIDPPEPEIDFGDAPDGYGTTLAANGARHEILPGFSLGATVDGEADGQPSAGATGDGADEDGVVFAGGVARAAACSLDNGLTVTLSNLAAVAAPRLDAWIDWNGNGVFDHPAEHLFGGSPVALPNGSSNLTYDVPCGALPQALSYARFRLSGLVAGSLPVGDGGTGEVEDHRFEITGPALDFGDAPAPYPTLEITGGARHVVLPVGNPTLGSAVDAESDGQPDASFLGDDLAGLPDDEDGVVFPGVLLPGTGTSVEVTTGATGGTLNAWIDWNHDGDWSDPGERIAIDVVLGAGVTTALPVTVPMAAVPGSTGARFRLSSMAGLAPAGLAPNGEVEDHVVAIAQETPVLGAAERVVSVTETEMAGIFEVVYELLLLNMGDVEIANVQAEADMALAFMAATSVSVVGLASSDFAVNGGYDGISDVLLLAGVDTLGVGEGGFVTLTLRVAPGENLGPYLCSTLVTGSSPAGVGVIDSSQDGPDPDPDDDGDPTNNDDPTPVSFERAVIALEVPTLGTWGLLSIAGGLALAALGRLRRPR